MFVGHGVSPRHNIFRGKRGVIAAAQPPWAGVPRPANSWECHRTGAARRADLGRKAAGDGFTREVLTLDESWRGRPVADATCPLR
jgi:hypothetical protein